MRNFKMVIQYEGTKYQGWQKQKTTKDTIQGKLEMILYRYSGYTVEVQGSGRTDAGVHAYGQVANFKMDTAASPGELMDYINKYLPEDIAVTALYEVPIRFHSRLNAKGKVYRYRVLNTEKKNVFERRYVYQVKEKLNLEEMREASLYLIGKHDFQSFTSAKKGKKSTIRKIERIDIKKDGDEVIFELQGDGFLYHMVRIIVGTLLAVGKGDLKKENVLKILNDRDRRQAGELVPAQGLALMKVFYDEDK